MERLIYFERPNVAVLEESEDIRTLWDGISKLRHTVFSDELSQYEQQESDDSKIQVNTSFVLL